MGVFRKSYLILVVSYLAVTLLSACSNTRPPSPLQQTDPPLKLRPSNAPSHVNDQRLMNGIRAYQEKDYISAFYIWLPLAREGHSLAQSYIGYMYVEGVGVAKNDSQALIWLQKAAKVGQVDAQNNLGYMYALGRGVSRDQKIAITWYLKAAQQGHRQAQKNLSAMSAKPRTSGFKKKTEKSQVSISLRAESGDAVAQYILGAQYFSGYGIEKNPNEAKEWFLKSARQGYATAQYQLGLMYLEGLGLAKNENEGLIWIKRSASRGFKTARNWIIDNQSKYKGRLRTSVFNDF